MIINFVFSSSSLPGVILDSNWVRPLCVVLSLLISGCPVDELKLGPPDQLALSTDPRNSGSERHTWDPLLLAPGSSTKTVGTGRSRPVLVSLKNFF